MALRLSRMPCLGSSGSSLVSRLRVNGTPTLVYADGLRTDGYVDAPEVERRLAAAAGRNGAQASAGTAQVQEKSP